VQFCGAVCYCVNFLVDYTEWHDDKVGEAVEHVHRMPLNKVASTSYRWVHWVHWIWSLFATAVAKSLTSADKCSRLARSAVERTCSAPDHDCVHCSTTWWRSHEVTQNGAALKRKQLSVFTYDTAPVITYSLTFGVFVLRNPNRIGFSETVHSVRESESGFETKLNVEPGYQTIRLASESESGFTVNLSCFWPTLYWHFYYLWFKKSYLWGVSQWVCL